jgi:imidazolonepropionase-like amidohydrolase
MKWLAAALMTWSPSADLVFQDCEVRTVCCADVSGGSVVVSGDEITHVGTQVPIPAGAEIIPCQGGVLTPGLVEADSTLGLTEILLEPRSNDAEPVLADPIRAGIRAQDGLDPRSTLVGVARRHGVTSVVTVPSGGVVEGQAAWLDLVSPGSRSIDSASIGPVAMSAHAGQMGALAYGQSRLTAFMVLQAFFEDVTAYRRNRSGYLRRAFYPTRAERRDLEAGVDVTTGDLPLMVEAHRASDILRVVDWADDARIDLILVGASEGHLVASELAEARVPVIVQPMHNLPHQFEARHVRTDNAAIMERAGVEVILATRDAHNVGNLRFAVGNAVRAGFPEARALEAVTLRPARAFGQKVGVIQAGAPASLVLWTADPFEPSSYAREVVIRGERQPVENRQSRLARRAIERLLPR